MLAINQTRISNTTKIMFTITANLGRKRWEWRTENGVYGASFEWTLLEKSEGHTVIESDASVVHSGNCWCVSNR